MTTQTFHNPYIYHVMISPNRKLAAVVYGKKMKAIFEKEGWCFSDSFKRHTTAAMTALLHSLKHNGD